MAGASGEMIGSTIRGSGDKIDVDKSKPVFVQGAWNLGGIITYKEIETTGFTPGMGVDPVAVATGVEDNVTIMASASVVVLGVAEIDFGQLTDCNATYALADDVPILYFHWQPGALLRNIQMETFVAHIQPGELIGTTSTTDGKFRDDVTTAVCLRSYKYVAQSSATILAFIHGYL